MKTKSFHLGSAAAFLIFGYLLFGIAHIAILPPWEGFDEFAHYSYVQQIADKWELPRPRAARMSRDVEEYFRFAPIRYRSKPPFETSRGYTYKSFFQASPETVAQGGDYIHKPPLKPRGYSKGTSRNWQAQHPPLYYFILSPVYLMTRHLSWASHLFILRLISYLFAWSALVLPFCTFFNLNPPYDSHQKLTRYHWSLLGVALWPALFPQWFPEMARLGNDSLSALIVSIIWVISIGVSHTKQWTRYSISLGLLLGLGCLTKAFFEPITVGILSFWVFRRLKSEGKPALKSVLIHFFLTCAVIVCVAGWWYIDILSTPGAVQAGIILKDTGRLGGKLAQNFTLLKWLRSNAAMVTTVAWGGTWSLARPPYAYLAPMSFIVVFTAVSYLLSLRGFPATGMRWLPLWLAVPVLMGLSYYIIANIGFMRQGAGVGGWYLHVLVVPLGVAVGHGLCAWWRKKGFRIITVSLLCYAVPFFIVVSCLQILLFSGLIIKGPNKFYQLTHALPPFFGLPEAFNRLKVLAFPELGLFMWICGEITVIIGLILTWKIARKFMTDSLYLRNLSVSKPLI